MGNEEGQKGRRAEKRKSGKGEAYGQGAAESCAAENCQESH